ncbi:hypothetical protein [Streptomyces sp. NPDC049881]|uniref:hypothetical protein n=1 Tax=Streptomyces sp. NPDC049881 TaxID=3155778 RepID=UPI0034249398
MSTHESSRRPGDGLVRVGGVVFLVGAVATLVTLVPLFVGADPLPSIAYAVSMLMGVGFLIAAAGLFLSISRQRTVAKAAQRQSQGTA